jgi:response regulator RpfG family c-di-GMP phosphodiesterase
MAEATRTMRSTVLVVDDEPGPRESLRMILTPHCRVLQARNGSEALETLRRESVQLATVDLNMPGMLGQELMRSIRAEFPEVEIIVITGCGSLESAAEGIRCGISDYLQKPFDVVQVTAAVVRALSRQQARTRLAAFLGALGEVLGPERPTHSILEDLKQSPALRSRLGGLLEVSAGAAPEPAAGAPRTIEFLEVLAETIEAKDRFMRGHARRVAVFASLLAARLRLSSEEQEQVRIAAFLHDLGKVGVPTDLLLRAGALDPAERRLVERHPEIGSRLLHPLAVPRPITLAVRHHHEWWDGSGYPDGLAGEEIPLVGRIVSVADAFDAMSCDRPYRRALAREHVVREFERFAGIQFDPRVVTEFLHILESSAAEDADARLCAEALARNGSAAPQAALAG